MRDNPLVQWAVAGLSVVAFILLLKMGAGMLPDSGPLGVVKSVVGGI